MQHNTKQSRRQAQRGKRKSLLGYSGEPKAQGLHSSETEKPKDKGPVFMLCAQVIAVMGEFELELKLLWVERVRMRRAKGQSGRAQLGGVGRRGCRV